MPVQIESVEFSGPESGPHVLITGGVHGDEFEPPLAIRRLISRMDSESNATPLLKGRLTCVPIVNQAAFRRGQRAAEDNLDLARVCPGRSDGSITEQTAAALTALIRSADFYIDLHSGGTAYSVLPLAGYMLHPDPSVLDRQRLMARSFNLPVVWGTSPDLDGRSLSVARDAGVPAIYAEYHGSGQCDPEGVAAYETGCLNLLAELGMIDRQRPESRIRHWVDDPRPGSGHMQRCYPAPVTGLFESSVRLGERVAAGELIGHIWTAPRTAAVAIHSEQSGILLTLRTFSRVLEGDSLAVIMELESEK